jgi:nitrile hydratase
MNGIHDMGGMHGFGRVPYKRQSPREDVLFPESWQGRVFGMLNLTSGAGLGNVDEFRHAIERIAPELYLSVGYYGRWMLSLQTMLIEHGIVSLEEIHHRARSLAAGEPPESLGRPVQLERHTGTSLRPLDRTPRFASGDRVRTINASPSGHTRLPRYARGKSGQIVQVYPSCVFPDKNAHHLGEDPQYVYAVQFTGEELWGSDAEPNTRMSLDLFEPYLEPDLPGANR